jgi:hypothetical protein
MAAVIPAAVAAGAAYAQTAVPTQSAPAAAPVMRHVTQGRAKTVIENLHRCASNHRIGAVGTISATDGTVVTVPAQTAFRNGPKAHDLYNECTQVTPRSAREAAPAASVPMVEVDAEGEEVTGYIVADNYFELYVNAKLIAVDPVPYTPMNSVIVRFRAKRPYTYAVKLVDWEEDLGLGTEVGVRDGPWYPGDGGFIAHFSDGTVTDSSWKAQSFYVAPLASPEDVVEKGNVHDTAKLGRVHPHAPKPGCQDRCHAVHYPIPANWQAAAFDDASWPHAFEFSDAEVGVTNLHAYTLLPELFQGARWIWSLNFVLDNLVLARKTVR